MNDYDKIIAAIRRYFDRTPRLDALMSIASMATATGMRSREVEDFLTGHTTELEDAGFCFHRGAVGRAAGCRPPVR